MAEVSEIVLVRHGETVENRAGILQGQAPHLGRLNDLGREQARRLGVALAGDRFDRVLVSSLTRARDTAHIILDCPTDHPRPEPVALDALREIHLGVLHGGPSDAWTAMSAGDPMAWHPEGGECWRDVQARVRPFLAEHIYGGPRDRVLVVAHGGVNKVLLTELLGLPLEAAWGDAPIRQGNCCINRITLGPAGEVVRSALNDVSHLR